MVNITVKWENKGIVFILLIDILSEKGLGRSVKSDMMKYGSYNWRQNNSFCFNCSYLKLTVTCTVSVMLVMTGTILS